MPRGRKRPRRQMIRKNYHDWDKPTDDGLVSALVIFTVIVSSFGPWEGCCTAVSSHNSTSHLKDNDALCQYVTHLP